MCGFDVLAGVGRPEFALSWSVFALLVVLAGCGGRVGLVERVGWVRWLGSVLHRIR